MLLSPVTDKSSPKNTLLTGVRPWSLVAAEVAALVEPPPRDRRAVDDLVELVLAAVLVEDVEPLTSLRALHS